MLKLVTIPAIAAVILFAIGCSTSRDGSHPASLTLVPIHNQVPALPADVYEVKDLDRPPIVLVPPRIVYPREFKKAGINGNAEVWFIINTDGIATNAVVLDATDVRFATAAIDAVGHMRFKPGKLRGKLVNCWAKQPFVFSTVKD